MLEQRHLYCTASWRAMPCGSWLPKRMRRLALPHLSCTGRSGEKLIVARRSLLEAHLPSGARSALFSVATCSMAAARCGSKGGQGLWGQRRSGGVGWRRWWLAAGCGPSTAGDRGAACERSDSCRPLSPSWRLGQALRGGDRRPLRPGSSWSGGCRPKRVHAPSQQDLAALQAAEPRSRSGASSPAAARRQRLSTKYESYAFSVCS